MIRMDRTCGSVRLPIQVHCVYLLTRNSETILVGPNELSFVDVDYIDTVFGLDGMDKGPSESHLAHCRPKE